MQIYRTEYPNPQFEREDWICLNGEWEFEIDNSKSGMERKLYNSDSLETIINVPFCPESELSGIGCKDFMECVWYRKKIEIPSSWNEKNVVVNFGAVDYHSIVFVNGKKVGEHKGGYTSFSFDITKYLNESDNVITLCVYDDLRRGNQPAGKQSGAYESSGCYYTRTTGIWQSVWLTSYENICVKRLKMYPNVDKCALDMEILLDGECDNTGIRVNAYYEGKKVGETVSGKSNISNRMIHLELSEKHLWEIGCGRLYDLEILVEKNDRLCDRVKSYFGLRNIGLKDKVMTLNGKKFFGRWVLDQGFYPDGLYTASTDEALKNDIIYSQKLGFNGARLHEKIFEPRFLYWADKLGYTVWEEHANWGLKFSNCGKLQCFLPEWMEAMERDFNHPSIVGWAPLNEAWDWLDNAGGTHAPCTEIFATIYQATKLYDPTRPVIDTSGGYHVKTDIYDMHDYAQDPAELKSRYGMGDTFFEVFPTREKHNGEPFFLSEYGGIKWSDNPDDRAASWGYGNTPKTSEEFIERYRGLTNVLLDNPCMLGFCYTQLYDIEQEQNGLMTYQREFKFDPQIFYQINTRKAACENE